MSPFEGVKIAECDNPLLRAIEIPRDSSHFACAIPELDTAGLYVLLNEMREGGRDILVGAAQMLPALIEGCATSLKGWHTAIFISRRFSSWNLEELTRLEAGLNSRIRAGSALALTPHRPLDGEPLRLFTEIQGICRLVELLGHRLDAPAAAALAPAEDLLYHLRAGPVLGKGRRLGEEFVVLAGSVGRRAAADSLSPASASQLRLLENGDVRVCGESLIFQRDSLFPSQAQAAGALLGHCTSGFFDWKRGSGRTLGQIERFIDTADEPTST